MKKLFLILIFLAVSIISLSAQEQGYPKKIIFGTFSQKSSAQRELYLFRAEPSYAELYKLALENDFAVHARPLANYTILAAEPIKSKSAFYAALKLIKTNYPHAYIISAEGLDEKIEKPLPPRVLQTATSREQPKNFKKVATPEKSMFKVEEVKEDMMLVSCQSANEKVEKIKKILKEEPETKVEQKQEAKVETEPEIKQELKIEQPQTKVEPVAEVKKEEPKKELKTVAPEPKKESFFASVLKYFTRDEPENVAKKSTKTISGVEVPDLGSGVKETSDEAEVPELNKSKTAAEENSSNKTLKKTEVPELASNDTQSMSDEGEVPELSDMSVDKNKSEPLKQELSQAIIDKKVEPTPETSLVKEPEKEKITEASAVEAPVIEKKPDWIPNVENIDIEESLVSEIFTLMNFVILMLLVGAWFAYKKFKKIYDEY